MPRFISGFGISSCGVGDLYAFPYRTSPSSPMHPVQVIRGGARCILCQCHHRRLMDICREAASHECPGTAHSPVGCPVASAFSIPGQYSPAARLTCGCSLFAPHWQPFITDIRQDSCHAVGVVSVCSEISLCFPIST